MILSTCVTVRQKCAILDAITDLDMKSKVLRLADDYDTLAERADDRAGGVRNYSPK